MDPTIVGTVSGTSISFGTAVVFDRAAAAVAYTATVFDSNSNKIVICYRDIGVTQIKQRLLLERYLERQYRLERQSCLLQEQTIYLAAHLIHPTTKLFFAYKDGGDSNKGKAIVGTVSDTSISFGTAVTFSGTDGVTKVGSYV